jgi:hypothetical protein
LQFRDKNIAAGRRAAHHAVTSTANISRNLVFQSKGGFKLMPKTMVTLITTLCWMSHSLALGGELKPLQLTWTDLGSQIAQGKMPRKFGLVLPDGTHIEGRVVRVEADGLRLDVRKTSDRKAHPKGEQLIPRQWVSVLRCTEYRSTGRLIGAIAAPAAVAAGMLAGAPRGGEGPGVVLIPVIGVGAAAGAAIGGYYVGKAVDKRVTEIRIVPDAEKRPL